MSKYGVISTSYFLVFGLNTGKYGTEIIPHLDTFHVVCLIDWILFVIYLSFVVLKCIGGGGEVFDSLTIDIFKRNKKFITFPYIKDLAKFDAAVCCHMHHRHDG